MSRDLGVWIDREKAILVSLDEQGRSSVEVIESGIESRKKSGGGGRGIGGKSQTAADDRRREQQRRFCKQVLDRLAEGERIQLYGPGETRKDLDRMMRERQELARRLVGSSKADSMTTPQLVAMVRDAFGAAARRQSRR